ncbi:hypothetical protein [Nocardia salmonicida]|uniref:hypothetical protein n=1 Tax=Nocardia salmonicida TaxID=53431 RepID=UPI0036367D21
MEVPALRGNPAGRLRAGVFTNPNGNGITQLAPAAPPPAFGDLTVDHIDDAAVTISSTSGAGGSDDYVEIYSDHRRIGEFVPVAPAHAEVTRLLITDGVLSVEWTAFDYSGQRAKHTARLRIEGDRVVPVADSPSNSAGRWTEPDVTITARSLGAVVVGMSLAQAEQNAGLTFDGRGSGAHYAVRQGPHLYVVGDPATCAGAGLTSTPSQTVHTPEGVALGDPESRITTVYGTRASFVPATGGRTPAAGYVVDFGPDVLAFSVRDAVITRIVGGPGVTPSTCGG